MKKIYKLQDIKNDGFLHSRVYEVIYEPERKISKLNLGFADLKDGGALIDCTVTISDWWDMKVIERGANVYKKYSTNEVPITIDQIIRYDYVENMLTLKSCGSLDIDAVIYFNFTKPKIDITGEFDSD